jgi:oligopeptide/dipeptide ABC transporter ATP-binding protein
MTFSKIVTIHDLTIHFATIDGIIKVLNDVNLYIKEGEIVGLVGETGCGKSIVAKTLLGVLQIPPAKIISGEIYFLGKTLFKSSRNERDLMKYKIGYIPQDPMTSLNPVFTIGEVLIDNIVWRMSNMRLLNYLLQRRLKRKNQLAEERACELLKKVHIPDPQNMLSKYPIELSGGMRQRALIAMSLVGNPALLIADEPTTALDVTIQKVILRLLLEKIREEKLSGLYITHDLGVAREICNRTYVMYAGTVVEAAETSVLLDNPLHPYTKGLVDSIPKLTGEKYQGIPGSVPDYLNPPKGCRFFLRCNKKLEGCDKEKPEFREVEKEHFVACKLFENK